MAEEVNREKHIPKFGSPEEEAKFWESHSPLDFSDEFEEVEMDVARPLKHKILSVRVDAETLQALAELAKRRKIGVSTLARMLIADALERERAS